MAVAGIGPKGKKNAGRRFAGIVADARALGTDRSHLWRVLSGRRESHRLITRYAVLKARQFAQRRPRQEASREARTR